VQYLGRNSVYSRTFNPYSTPHLNSGACWVIRTRNGASQRYVRQPKSDPMQVTMWDYGVA